MLEALIALMIQIIDVKKRYFTTNVSSKSEDANTPSRDFENSPCKRFSHLICN